MADLFYPTELPRPVAAPFTPAPRVRRTDVTGPTAQAARERDFRGTSEVEWLLRGSEAELWKLWWQYDTREGGSQYVCTWPTPMGQAVPHVRRFLSTPTWALQARGALDSIWRVSARTELLGRYVGELNRALVSIFDIPQWYLFAGYLDLGLNERWAPDFEPADFGWRGSLDQALNAEMPVA